MPAAIAPYDKPLLFVDFNDQYHVVRRAWGNRKINVPALGREFSDCGEKIALVKSPDIKKAARFLKVLDLCGFHRVCIYSAPRYVGCSVVLASIISCAKTEDPVVHVHVVTSDPEIDFILDRFPGTGWRYSFADGPGYVNVLSPTLLTPIPVETRMELDDDCGVD